MQAKVWALWCPGQRRCLWGRGHNQEGMVGVCMMSGVLVLDRWGWTQPVLDVFLCEATWYFRSLVKWDLCPHYSLGALTTAQLLSFGKEASWLAGCDQDVVHTRTSGFRESMYLEFLKNMLDKTKEVNMRKYMESQRGKTGSDTPQEPPKWAQTYRHSGAREGTKNCLDRTCHLSSHLELLTPVFSLLPIFNRCQTHARLAGHLPSSAPSRTPCPSLWLTSGSQWKVWPSLICNPGSKGESAQVVLMIWTLCMGLPHRCHTSEM